MEGSTEEEQFEELGKRTPIRGSII
jgi:hypothetical protein